MLQFSKWEKKLIGLSLAANLIFLLLFGYIILKKGGTGYLAKRVKSIFQTDKSATTSSDSDKRKLSYPAHYFGRKSIYESLPDEENEIIFLGDSITDDGPWSELFKDLKIKNRGLPGDRTDGVLDRLPEVLASSPKKIFLMIGYNDLSKGVKMETILLNYEEILQTIKAQSPATQIYIQSVLPVNDHFYKGRVRNQNVIELNRHLKKLSKKFNTHYLDLYADFKDADLQLRADFAGQDGLHLNGKAYLKWKTIVENQVYN